MTTRQKHKGKKRSRSWHRRGKGPDWAFADAMRRLNRASARSVLKSEEDE